MKRSRMAMGIFLLWHLCLCISCRRDMFVQPKSNPLRENDFFPDNAASRPIPPHTVSQESASYKDSYSTGKKGTNFIADFPFPITRAVLERGKQEFEVYCVPCHGHCGDGDGMVVQRGLPAPASLNIERLRGAPPGYFVAAIANGYGIMFPQASQVTPKDRWAITAYIRALQLSQHVRLKELPADDVAKLNATSP